MIQIVYVYFFTYHISGFVSRVDYLGIGTFCCV